MSKGFQSYIHTGRYNHSFQCCISLLRMIGSLHRLGNKAIYREGYNPFAKTKCDCTMPKSVHFTRNFFRWSLLNALYISLNDSMTFLKFVSLMSSVNRIQFVLLITLRVDCGTQPSDLGFLVDTRLVIAICKNEWAILLYVGPYAILLGV